MGFSLFKIAELGSAKRNFGTGTYSWDAIPAIRDAVYGQFSLVNTEKLPWLTSLLGTAVFDLLERVAAPRQSRDEVLAAILADPVFSGKDASSPEVRQELGNRMRAQAGQKPASPAEVIAFANSDAGQLSLQAAMASAGLPLEELHTYIEFAAQRNPQDFFDHISATAFAKRVNELRAEAARTQPQSTTGTAESSNEIMDYIRQHPSLDAGLTIEAFGATHYTQTNAEAGKALAERCLAEQNEGGGVCVHSVHLNKVLGGISLFASVRGPKREHVATIKFEDGLVYEIKGHNNGLVANQLQASEAEKQTMRSAIKSYISKMLTDGVVSGFSQAGEADFANLLHPEEISSAIGSGTEDYSAILPSHKMSSEQIEIIWDRIRDDKSRTKEFAAMAGNKNTPPEIQRDLLAIGDKSVDAALARNKNLDPEVHDQLSMHADRLVRHRALAHPLGYKKEVDQEEILKMLGSRDSKVVARAAASPLAPQEKLLELGANPLTDPNIKANLLINPNIKLGAKQKIFETMPISAQLSVLNSNNYGASSKDIRWLKLSRDARPDGLSAEQLVEFARRAPISGLRLALDSKDANSDVLRAGTKNPVTTPEILNVILGHPKADDRVLGAVAISSVATPEMIDAILKHPKAGPFAISAVAGSSAATPEIINSILNRPEVDSIVLSAVALSRATTPETLNVILNHPKADHNAIYNVAGSRAATPEILESIVKNTKAGDYAKMRAKNLLAEMTKKTSSLSAFPLFKRSSRAFRLFH